IETYVRGRTLEGIRDANEKVDRALRAGALALGAEVEIDTLPGYLPLRTDATMARAFRRNADALFGAGECREAGHRTGSTDMGDPDKPQQIIDAAIRVFARNGYYNSRVSDIAREAGIASGTIYLYFKTKDEILVTLFREKMAGWVASVRREVAAERDPLAKVRKIVALHFRVLEENPELAEVLQVELRQGQKFFRGASAHEVSAYFGVIND